MADLPSLADDIRKTIDTVNSLNWMRGREACDKAGRTVDPCSDQVFSACLFGSIKRAGTRDGHLIPAIASRIRSEFRLPAVWTPFEVVIWFNDHACSGKTDVLELLCELQAAVEDAIVQAEAEQ